LRTRANSAANPGNGREWDEALVREQFANGPAPGECVKAAAADAKVSERFLIAAADRLGMGQVVVLKSG
jgi:hypothetical protein